MDRKSLRKKVMSLLKGAAIGDIGEDVFSQRSIPTDVHSLPVALVYIQDVSVDRLDEAPKRYLENAQVVIEVVTKHNDDEQLADEMDDLSALVELAMEGDLELEKELNSMNLVSIFNQTEGDGQSPIGSSKLTYMCEYVREPRPEPVLDDLETIHTEYKINDAEDTVSDSITYEE